ncbi:uncharacterized protein LOC105798629 [Gossypium raimondii]|uniref:uncharacterized protein LOC105798629 n=1 Tax=Gossypium raimondii TaxID=29730 RepID=UPI00063ADFD6|nr:uncharacterized protein LOC105798629 [Gossypium raimondii]
MPPHSFSSVASTNSKPHLAPIWTEQIRLSPSPRRFFDPLFNSDDDREKGDAVTRCGVCCVQVQPGEGAHGLGAEAQHARGSDSAAARGQKVAAAEARKHFRNPSGFWDSSRLVWALIGSGLVGLRFRFRFGL